MNKQLEGIEQIEGTYPFDLKVSVRALRINRFFWELRKPENRQLFLEQGDEAFRRAGLTEEERAMVLARDWIGLVRYGVNFFVLEKFARVVRMSNMEVYASMRGETLEEFLKTRRVPDAR
ncbi:protocatechuate 3,4-dioxygenase [Piscinibacter sp.]|uniref:protocatechuate 3,4-dioxygenase n=1 Tax=Piscinibacter sp. TaxID=1903157 RepID=UPI002CDDE8F3|nr:protocatechuate 3,4-dioxygenase [Albitalea sp.]HUG26293.1 protocatechuate 3,4-dioxygenase [Albitalea sp.]